MYLTQAIKQMWKMRLREVQGLAEGTLLPDSLLMGLLVHQMVLLKGPARTCFFCDGGSSVHTCTPHCLQMKCKTTGHTNPLTLTSDLWPPL